MFSVEKEEFCPGVVIRFVFFEAKLIHFYLQFPMFMRVENAIMVFILCIDVVI